MRQGRRRVAMAGFMGVGKSTVGPLLAQRLGVPFVDLDEVIVQMEGRSIGQIFALRGESAFRAAEASALATTLQGPECVLALGGGTLHQPGARARLTGAGYVVVGLLASWETLARRLEQSAGGRPLLGEAVALFSNREDGYRNADVLVHTDDLRPDEIAGLIVERLATAS